MLTLHNPVFDQFWNTLAHDQNLARRAWTWTAFSPAADVRETEKSYRLELDVPGLSEKDVTVTVEGRHLTVMGARKIEENVSFSRQERAFGEFERLFHLPDDADAAQIDARVSCGVLTIDIPKREDARSRTVSVRVG